MIFAEKMQKGKLKITSLGITSADQFRRCQSSRNQKSQRKNYKIQNFKLKIFLKFFFENLVRGHRSIFLIIDFFEP